MLTLTRVHNKQLNFKRNWYFKAKYLFPNPYIQEFAIQEFVIFSVYCKKRTKSMICEVYKFIGSKTQVTKLLKYVSKHWHKTIFISQYLEHLFSEQKFQIYYNIISLWIIYINVKEMIYNYYTDVFFFVFKVCIAMNVNSAPEKNNSCNCIFDLEQK